MLSLSVNAKKNGPPGDPAGEERRQLWSVVGTFAGVFPNVVLYFHLGRDYPERQNFLLACAAEAEHRFPERAGSFERWPRVAPRWSSSSPRRRSAR